MYTGKVLPCGIDAAMVGTIFGAAVGGIFLVIALGFGIHHLIKNRSTNSEPKSTAGKKAEARNAGNEWEFT